jgi:hypothetical protein
VAFPFKVCLKNGEFEHWIEENEKWKKFDTDY